MSAGRLVDVAREAAEAAGAVALHWQRRAEELTVEQKAGPRDLVSEADRQAEQAIRRVIERHRPGDGILGEEGGTTQGRSDVQWVVDPIDGTTSYLYGRADWAVSVAAVSVSTRQVLAAVVAEPGLDRVTSAELGSGAWTDGRRLAVRPVQDLERALVEVNFGRSEQHPSAGPMVSALLPEVRDLRRGGSAAAALSQLAGARADAAWLPGLQPWDGSAGVLLAHEAGAVVGDLTGDCGPTWPASGDVLAAAPALTDELRALLRRAYPGGSRLPFSTGSIPRPSATRP